MFSRKELTLSSHTKSWCTPSALLPSISIANCAF